VIPYLYILFQQYAFEKLAWGSTAVSLKTSYDYGLIMHYSTAFFSKNGQPAIVPKQAGARIGYRPTRLVRRTFLKFLDYTDVKLRLLDASTTSEQCYRSKQEG
jgi:hypothetical protein